MGALTGFADGVRAFRRGALVLLLLTPLACNKSRMVDGLPVASANDNRVRAGEMRGDTLALSLVVQMARWYPEADPGPHVDAPVFAEEGNAPQIPAPLIRVTTGTIVAATVRNALLDSTLRVVGLSSRPAGEPLDTLIIPPGETRSVTFEVGAHGTYMYAAQAGTVDWDIREREQLAGAFVVDSVGAPADDRVFVMNVWGEPRDSINYDNAVAINGRAWPHTERLFASMGDSIRWRWVNATVRPHPMHLHGFYYQVTARGDMARDTIYSHGTQRTVVTESMKPFSTLSLAFEPDRPGNWLFHCHIGFHVLGTARLGPSDHADHASSDVGRHMAGLVLGLTVNPAPEWREPPRAGTRAVRLLVHEGARRSHALRNLSFMLQQGTTEPSPQTARAPGSLLVLTRDEPTDITVVNRLREPTAVHWHGIELESYSDGVVGFSGDSSRLAPMIAPGDSFTARLSLPRSGTFIYHTHLNDLEQLTSGLYGPIVVLEPGAMHDPERDRVFVAAWDGDEEPPKLVINGDSALPQADLRRGTSYRLRFVNIGPAASIRALLTRGADTVSWRALAKDGFDVPVHSAHAQRAVLVLDVGETADFEFTPDQVGTYSLHFAHAPRLRPVVQKFRVR